MLKRYVKGITLLVLILGTVYVAIAAPVLTRIDVLPPSISLGVGNTATFIAIGFDQNSSTMTIVPPATWNSSNTTVGTINAAGVFTALAAGTATIRATSVNVIGNSAVTVSMPILTSINVSPPSALVVIGNTKIFTAITRDQFNNPINATVTWNSSNTTVGTIINAGGVFTALSAGTTTINAASGNVNGNAAATVKALLANVANITVIDRGQTSITWTWENPLDVDFSGTRILIDNDNIPRVVLPKTSNSYNATGFAPGTTHTITVIAFDTSNNSAAQPFPTNSSATLPNTPTGNNVTPTGLPPEVVINFANVTGEGNTVASRTNASAGPFEPLVSYDIITTANFTGNVAVTLNYPVPKPGYNENTIRLYHLNGSVWQDVTTAPPDTTARKVTGEVASLSFFAAGIDPPPQINVIRQPPNLDVTVGDQLFFNISVTQEANVTWTVNANISKPLALVQANVRSDFPFKPPAAGNYTVRVDANNTNGTANRSWTVAAHPKSFFRGNRIWDGAKCSNEISPIYTWTPQSFSGFYYDIRDDVGSESITIKLGGCDVGSIDSGALNYTTTPQDVKFGFDQFGSYKVIGFMADKYFAGYTTSSLSDPALNPTTKIGAEKSVLAQGQLHKVLIDDDTRRSISVGSTLTLQEGYVLKAADIDASARTMLITLLKDGNEVDTAPLTAGQTYVFTKRVGVVQDLPIIIVRFDGVFSGREVQLAFLKGMFQISESATTVKSGNEFGVMKVSSVGGNGIEMKNDGSIDLSAGSVVDLMGDVKIVVADNSSVLRFALSVEKAGSFEVRSSIYKENDTVDEWNPYNFGMNIGKTSIGFYYDLDDGIGNESLKIDQTLDGAGSSIDDGKLIYRTTPQEVRFGFDRFGSYQVIGFMADKYFAGYTDSSLSDTTLSPTTSIGAKSVLAQGQLHKVLIDDDTQRSISVGSTLTLKEGYVLKAADIDASARTMLITLLKDGSEVDNTPLSAGQTYVFTKRVGAVSDLPIIIVRFDGVFSGREVQLAFLKGMFQISETATTVKAGNEFGKMKVNSVGGSGIEMRNDGSISLEVGSAEELMGNIQLRVGDTTDGSLRFYLAVDVTPATLADQLVIDAPAKANAGDPVNIKVTAGGSAVENASVAIDSIEAGLTGSDGVLNYTLPRTLKGVHNITATKLGYQEATASIEVLEYIERRLSIDAPTKANQFETITITVTYNGTPMSSATVAYDNATIGLTDIKGSLNYTLDASGTHTISASKNGYVTALRDIDVRAPFSEFKALDINITPRVIFTDENALVRSNITNTGTKADAVTVELLANGTVIDNKSITLTPGEIKEINFTLGFDLIKTKFNTEGKQALPGNYTIEIAGPLLSLKQTELLEVKEKPMNLLLVGGILTVIGAIVIYLFTAKNGEYLELIREKFNSLISAIKRRG